jgi:hypothetical protein
VQVQVDGAMKMRGDQELQDVLQAQDDAPFTMLVVTAESLCDEPDIDTGQLLGPLVLSAGRTIVVGDTGEGKTTACLQIMKSILAGDDFMGWEGAGTGRALIIDLEQGRRSVKRSLRDAGLDTRNDVDLVLVPDGLSLGQDSSHFNELDRVIAEGGYTIVLLDPYYKAHRADEPNAERPIVDLMRMLDRLRSDYGFALILPAHPRKEMVGSSGPRKLTLHDIAGSGAVSRGAEVILGIEKVAHGMARLRFLKDREGDLEVGEAYHLLFTKGEGFRRDPKDLEPPKDYVQLIRETGDTEWRTLPEWRVLIGSGKPKAEAALEELRTNDPPEVEYSEEKAVHGKRRGAKCWRLVSGLEGVRLVVPESGSSEQNQLTGLLVPPVLGTSRDQLDSSETANGPDDLRPLDEEDDGIPF